MNSSTDDSQTNLLQESAEPSGCGASICCNPHKFLYRFVALFFICFLSFGSYFCYDNPAALADNFITDLGLDINQYAALYSVYSWPNVVLSFMGGYLIDRVFGIRFGAILFSGFIMSGQIVFAAGALVNHYWLMILGRLIFACGGESLAVAQNAFAVKWFKGKELNTVFGITLSFARIGSTVNMWAMKPLYNVMSSVATGAPYVVLGGALMAAGASTIISWLCAVVLALLDKRNDRFLHSKAQTFTDKQDGATAKKPEDEVVKMADLFHLPATMWLLCVICVAYYVTIFPFVSFGLIYFESKYMLPPDDAAKCNSLIYLSSIFASPFCGILVDVTGRNALWIVVAILVTIFGHCLFAFTFLTPYVPMTIIGVAYSLLASSLWPSISYVVPKRVLGTAYGIVQSIQNLGLALLFFSVGPVVEAKGYIALELYFLAFLCVALGSAFMLIFVDLSHTGILNMSSAKQKAFVKQETKKD